MNSAGRVELAWMPPTVPATRNTYSGRAWSNQRSTANWSRKSSSDLEGASRAWKPSDLSRRRIAEPTRPLWPAMKTREDRLSGDFNMSDDDVNKRHAEWSRDRSFEARSGFNLGLCEISRRAMVCAPSRRNQF